MCGSTIGSQEILAGSLLPLRLPVAVNRVLVLRVRFCSSVSGARGAASDHCDKQFVYRSSPASALYDFVVRCQTYRERFRDTLFILSVESGRLPQSLPNDDCMMQRDVRGLGLIHSGNCGGSHIVGLL